MSARIARGQRMHHARLPVYRWLSLHKFRKMRSDSLFVKTSPFLALFTEECTAETAADLTNS